MGALAALGISAAVGAYGAHKASETATTAANIQSQSATNAMGIEQNAANQALGVYGQGTQQAAANLAPYQALGQQGMANLGRTPTANNQGTVLPPGGYTLGNMQPQTQAPAPFGAAGGTLGMGGAGTPNAGQMVLMQAPTGETSMIPASQVAAAQAKGAKVIGSPGVSRTQW